MLDFKKNYFELFGLPVSYTVDRAALASHYRDLQRKIHPDRFANASDQEKRISMQGAALLNQALETLKDPILRGRYLLSLRGVEMDVTKSTGDAAFLMEQLELREELAEAKASADPYEVIGRIMADIKKRLDAFGEELAALFDESGPKELEAVEEILRKMQFLQKLQHDAELLETELED